MQSDFSTQASEFGIRNSESAKGHITHFTQLDAWQLGDELTVRIYKWTEEFPKEEAYGVTAQLRDSCVSITSKIAEGFGRYHWADKRKFYINARGSAFETESQLIESARVGLLSADKAKEGIELCRRIQQSLNGLIRKMNNSNSGFRIPDSEIRSTK